MSSLGKFPLKAEAPEDRKPYTDSNFLRAAELLGITLSDIKSLWAPGVAFLATLCEELAI